MARINPVNPIVNVDNSITGTVSGITKSQADNLYAPISLVSTTTGSGFNNTFYQAFPSSGLADYVKADLGLNTELPGFFPIYDNPLNLLSTTKTMSSTAPWTCQRYYNRTSPRQVVVQGKLWYADRPLSVLGVRFYCASTGVTSASGTALNSLNVTSNTLKSNTYAWFTILKANTATNTTNQKYAPLGPYDGNTKPTPQSLLQMTLQGAASVIVPTEVSTSYNLLYNFAKPIDIPQGDWFWVISATEAHYIDDVNPDKPSQWHCWVHGGNQSMYNFASGGLIRYNAIYYKTLQDNINIGITPGMTGTLSSGFESWTEASSTGSNIGQIFQSLTVGFATDQDRPYFANTNPASGFHCSLAHLYNHLILRPTK